MYGFTQGSALYSDFQCGGKITLSEVSFDPWQKADHTVCQAEDPLAAGNQGKIKVSLVALVKLMEIPQYTSTRQHQYGFMHIYRPSKQISETAAAFGLRQMN